MLRLAQILLQCDIPVEDLLCRVLAHIAVVPRLIDDTSDIGLSVGVAVDKAVPPGIGHEPLLGLRALLSRGQVLRNKTEI